MRSLGVALTMALLSTSAHADPTLAETTDFLARRIPEFSGVTLNDTFAVTKCTFQQRAEVHVAEVSAKGCAFGFTIHIQNSVVVSQTPGADDVCERAQVIPGSKVDFRIELSFADLDGTIAASPDEGLLSRYLGQTLEKGHRQTATPNDMTVVWIRSSAKRILSNGKATDAVAVLIADKDMAGRLAKAATYATAQCQKERKSDPF
jgi:hypothetical protein